VDPDQRLAVLGIRHRDLVDPEELGAAASMSADGPHGSHRACLLSGRVADDALLTFLSPEVWRGDPDATAA
jgi:hypothetical protein